VETEHEPVACLGVEEEDRRSAFGRHGELRAQLAVCVDEADGSRVELVRRRGLARQRKGSAEMAGDDGGCETAQEAGSAGRDRVVHGPRPFRYFAVDAW